MRAALENLIGNAWKYSSRVEHARIEIGVTVAEVERVFFVRDNGAGFDMKDASRLFTPFQRLHNASEFEGTGIGLTAVQRIIERHGGRIWAEAHLGRGATFLFQLTPSPEASGET
jgi:light-regulated signal transduction histidine kinase (bacteriophytochrome)